MSATEVMEVGYDAASVGEIARRAGASKQTIYARYSSKAELFKAVMMRRSEALHVQFGEALAEGKSIEQALYDYAFALIDRTLDPTNRQIMRTLIAAVTTFPELGSAFFQSGPEKGKQLLADYLRGQSSKGSLLVPDPELAAEVFIGACIGRLLPSLNLAPEFIPSTSHRRKYVKEAVRVFVKAYRTEPHS